MLEVRGLSFKRNSGRETREILKEIDLTVKAGEFVALKGPSGCGKTTLLRCISFLEKPTSGKILFDGRVITHPSEISGFRKKTGFVFQDHGLWSLKTVTENIVLPLVLVHGVSAEKARLQADDMLKQMGIDHRDKAFPSELSGGEKQRLAFARALAIRPKLLILDEPSASLDQERSLNLQVLLKAERSKGTAILMSTHDASYLPLFDRIYEFSSDTFKETKGSST